MKKKLKEEENERYNFKEEKAVKQTSEFDV
jgi:hypothetical protein